MENIQSINEVLATLTVKQIFFLVLDVVCVGLLFFFIFKIMYKEKMGRQIISIIIMVYLVYWLSGIFNLNILHSIISQVMSWGVVLIFILFQKEIRNFFDNKNIMSLVSDLFSKKETIDPDRDLMIVPRALTTLSEKRIGSIFVIKVNDNLDEYTTNSVLIDAKISTTLITSIFQKKSPLHDGAVIIENDRLMFGSVYFPIDVELNIDSNYGSRHRAGMTISKIKDVIVLITSEETGEISVIHDGKQFSDLGIEAIQEFIKEKMLLKKYLI